MVSIRSGYSKEVREKLMDLVSGQSKKIILIRREPNRKNKQTGGKENEKRKSS